MQSVTITSKYRVTIPPEIRKRLGIKPGDKVAFIPRKNSLEMVVVSSVDENLYESPSEIDLIGEQKKKTKRIDELL
jgi:AbrB family looped-hinge helix DNA binding protein